MKKESLMKLKTNNKVIILNPFNPRKMRGECDSLHKAILYLLRK